MRVDDVPLDVSGEHIEILFRDLDRTEYLFGFRTLAVEPEQLQSEGPPSNHHTLKAAAKSYADNLWINFEEEVYAVGHGLPKRCSPDGVNWL